MRLRETLGEAFYSLGMNVLFVDPERAIEFFNDGISLPCLRALGSHSSAFPVFGNNHILISAAMVSFLGEGSASRS